MKKFVLRHWRGSGQVMADVMKDYYYDYPKSMNIKPYSLSECICKIINEDEFLKFIVDRQGVKAHNQAVLKHNLNLCNIIK